MKICLELITCGEIHTYLTTDCKANHFSKTNVDHIKYLERVSFFKGRYSSKNYVKSSLLIKYPELKCQNPK